LGNGDSGDINIDATESITVQGIGSRERGISSTSIATQILGTGNSGDVNIVTEQLSVLDSGLISSQNLGGKGNVGNVEITANNILLDGQADTSIAPSLIQSDLISSQDSIFGNLRDRIAEGKGGNVTINTESLSIKNGSSINSNNFGAIGDAGSITINADNEILIDGTAPLFFEGENQGTVSSISVSSFNIETENFSSVAVGDAGSITINTPRFSVSNGAQISGFIRGEGNAGSIIINADEFVSLSGASFIATGVQEGIGNGGNLTINTKKLTAIDASEILVSTFDDGNAGTLTINATESIELSGVTDKFRDGLFADALKGSGNGGNVNVLTDKVRVF
jgi:large exoprotein involved in heme utilization and adhesion